MRAVCLISVTHLRSSCERNTEKRPRRRWNERKGEKGELLGKKAVCEEEDEDEDEEEEKMKEEEEEDEVS